MRLELLPCLTFAAALLSATPLLSAADAPNHEKAAEPLHLSHGETLALTDFTVPGKTTIFDFYSEFCPPCRQVGPHLVKLHAARADISVVEIDINRPGVRGIDWKSPVAQQYGLGSIPHFTIVGPDGKTQADGDEAWDKVNALIAANENK